MKKISIVGFVISFVSVVGALALTGQLSFVEATSAAAPTVETLSVADITNTTATFRGVVNNKGGANGHAWFEYGPDGVSWPWKAGIKGINGDQNQNFSVSVTGLQPNTTYHVKFIAENSVGKMFGQKVTFRTTSSGGSGQSCANGSTLSLEETKSAIHAGRIIVTPSINDSSLHADFVIVNNTGCTVPLSLAAFKVFDRVFANQVRFSATAVTNIAPGQSKTLGIALPSCMAQIDLYHGAAPQSLSNDLNHSSHTHALWARFNRGTGTNIHDVTGQFCSNPQPQNFTATLKIVKTVVNNNGGTRQPSDFTFTMNGTQVSHNQERTFTFDNSSDSTAITVTETNSSGYTAGNWGGDCSSGGTITLRPGEHKTCTITNDDIPQSIPTLNGSCVASHSSANINDSITWTATASGGVGSYTYSWSGTDGLSGTSQSLSRSYGSSGTKSATVVITSGGQSISRECTMVINQPSTSSLSVSCYANASSMNTGSSVTYSTSVSGGTGNYSYSWNGTDGLSGSGNSITYSYGNSGSKTATVVVTSGSQSASAQCFVTVNQQSSSGLNVSCYANPSSTYRYNTVTFSASASGGNGSYSYSWSGADDLSGSGSAVSKSYSTIGRKHATVTVWSGNQSSTQTCYTDILGDGGSTSSLNAYCQASPGTAVVGSTITWRVYPSGGTGSYSYSWSGTDNLSYSGPSDTVLKSYQSAGTKNTSVTVYSGGQSTTANCSVPITQAGIVTVFRENPGQVAGVFLSQVPYTGIDGNLKITLFILALFVWSSWISYLIIKRKAKKNGMTMSEVFTGSYPTLAFAGGIQTLQSPRMQNKIENKIEGGAVKSPFVEPKIEDTIPQVPTDDTFGQFFNQAGSKTAVAEKKIQKQEIKIERKIQLPSQAQMMMPSSKEAVVEGLEMKARELQTVVSADGLEIIAKASANNKHSALVILSHLVELYKDIEHEVEGDWMVLNSEKINKILFSTYITMTPVFIQWLVEGNDKKAMAFVRMLQMRDQSITREFITNIVLELDKAYRYRAEHEGEADAQILDLTMGWSDRELEFVVHTLVSAVDQTYSSVYSSIKIALIKVLDISRTKLHS